MELKIRRCLDCLACYIDSYDDPYRKCALIPARNHEGHVLHNVYTTIDDDCPLINENITLKLDRTACLCGEDNGTGAVLPHKTWCPKA